MPTSSAERQRRHRDRKRAGVRVFQVEVSDETIARFVSIGWLSVAETHDRRRVTAALEDLADCFARDTLDPPVSVTSSTKS